jgi:hypothetical protein
MGILPLFRNRRLAAHLLHRQRSRLSALSHSAFFGHSGV